ncbi:MAG: SpoIIE family protein phosphatase [Solirubrobacteraceae bacterium]|jgi:PAS domain S-box-containing protein
MTATMTELILDRAPSAVISIDERGVVTYWNPSAERTFGIAREQAIGRPVSELIIPERLRAAHLAGIARFLADGTGRLLDRSVQMPAARADGTEFPVQITISAVSEGGGWAFHAFVQDISQRVEAERERERLVVELRQALHGSQRRFDAIVGSLGDPVTIRDRQDRIVYANQSALAYLGFTSWEQLRSTPPAQIMADYLVSGEDGREVVMDDIPSVRILRGEPAQPLLIRTVHRRTGKQAWQLLKAAPLLDDAGEVEATILIIENVSEQKRAERQVAFLAQASDVLASSLDYEQTLRNVARLAVPDIADWCAVDLVDEEGERRQVAIAHVDADRIKLAEQLRSYEPLRLDPGRGVGLVLRTGEPLRYPEITDEQLIAAAVDERHLGLLRAAGPRSAAVVPMRLGKRILGAMTLVSAESGRVLDELDLELAQQVAARAAVAIENSRLYSERSSIAHMLQQSLLPEQLPEIPGYELASVYIPAFESNEVGGDFYDVWELEDCWMMVIGDVTGKGVEAAALTALVRHSIRVASEYERTPAGLLARVDAILKKQRGRSLCTALCVRLDRDRVTIAAGGHPLPLYIGAEGVSWVGEHGPLLGGFADVRWRDVSLELEPGGVLVTYTDGVTDAVGEGGTRYGPRRLCRTLSECGGVSAAGVIECLTAALSEFQIGAHADDTAALVLRRSPAGARHDLIATREGDRRAARRDVTEPG